MRTWEYRKSINLREIHEDTYNVEYFDMMDKDGWELVSAFKERDCQYTQFYWKRKIKPKPAKRDS